MRRTVAVSHAVTLPPTQSISTTRASRRSAPITPTARSTPKLGSSASFQLTTAGTATLSVPMRIVTP